MRPSRVGGVLLAEWTKIRSLRSTAWTLILFVVLTVGITAGLTALVVAEWNNPQPNGNNGHLAIIADPVGFILGTGIFFGQLTICVLGVLAITGEYSSGVIKVSLLAVPKRLRLLATKAVVFAAIVLVLGEIVVFGSFFVGAALMHAHVPVSLGDQGVTRAVVGAGLYLTVLGLFAMAIGALIRHTAGAIATVIGIVLVLPIITNFLPGSWGAHVNAYLPEQAGSLVASTGSAPGRPQLLSAWQGFGVFCLWTIALLAAAGYLLRRRDA